MFFQFSETTFDRTTKILRLNYVGPDNQEFCEAIDLGSVDYISQEALESPNFSAAVKILHLISGVSYYKLYFGAPVDISKYSLSEIEAELCNKVYSLGLAEFIFRNKLNFEECPFFLPHVAVQSRPPAINKARGALVPIGGGKDSIVTVEAMKLLGEVSGFFVGDNRIIDKIASIASVPLLKVGRHLDELLFAMNEKGGLNGHVPVTAINSAIAVVCGVLGGYSSVVFSNERSADYGNNIDGDSFAINHQWSKSSEFERLFSELVRECIDPDLSYFSALRDLNEMQIMGSFRNIPQYFHHFTSCNRAFRIHRPRAVHWCGECEKCAFVFLAVGATIGYSAAVEIFQKDLFLDDNLVETYLGLCGLSGIRKPFECVGELDECRAAASELLKIDQVVMTPVGRVLKQHFSKLDIGVPDLSEIMTKQYTPLGLGAEKVKDALAAI